MKNGCNEHLEAKIAEGDERTKKIYRYVSDVSRRIGEATASSVNVSELFNTDIEALRQKLRENCEKLFFCDPLNYGKKSLELLWRKVYYDTVCAAKKLRETSNEFDGYLFTHIMSGIGHFHHIISRIECEMKVKINGLDYMPLDIDEEIIEDGNQKLDEEELQFARSSLFNCLIYLGDLSRYRVEIFNTLDSSIAVRYYLQAAQIDLCSGMPYNQLGNLFLDKNYNLDSVCYYIHCLSTISPFEGAIGNLTKIFEKNNQFLETINDSEMCTQVEHIQNTIAEFLSLIEKWYLGEKDSNVSKLCGNIAQKLKIGMDFPVNVLPDINENYVEYSKAIEEEYNNPSFINSNMIHNIVEICLFTNAKLAEVDEPQAFACKAFTFAFFSQLLQKLHKHLLSLGLKMPTYQFKPKQYFRQLKESKDVKDSEANNFESSIICNGNQNNIITNEMPLKSLSDEEKSKVLNGDSKSCKKSLTKRRRRRRIMSSDSSDVSDADTESSEAESDKSECENEDQLSDSTYVSEDDSQSDDSVDEEIDNKNVSVNGISHSDTLLKTKDNFGNNTDQILKSEDEKNGKESENNVENKFDVEGIQNFLMGDNFLSSIKLLQDWILTEKNLILSCGESGESLFQCVVDLLNIFQYFFISKTPLPRTDCKIFEYTKAVAKKLKLEYKTIPLPEDINLRGTNICKFDKDAAEWQLLEKYKPSVYEENIIRILHFIDFGYQIAKIVPRIRFNRIMKIFFLKKLLPVKINTKANHKKCREWHNSKKPLEAKAKEGGLLRRLGQLWLVSKVKELESTGHSPVPSLLALDTAALYKHLKRVKQLLRTKNFIFIIPNVVLQELDKLKRECSSARDAIRWLEVQLKRGSRFLRTQRPGQSKPLPLLKYPKKAPPQVHNYVQILEFCNHFIEDEKHNQSGGDSDLVHGKAASLLILLVGNEPTDEEQFEDFSLTGAAQTAGICVEYIGDFFAKWRRAVQKSAKKR